MVGLVSSNVLKGDEKLLKIRDEMGTVATYVNSSDFPDELKREIKQYFQGSSPGSSLSASEMFEHLSQSLRLEMSSEVTRKCLDTCPLFHGCSPQLKNSIKGLLREVDIDSEEILFEINTVAHYMYFVISGKVEHISVSSNGDASVVSRYAPGGSVGILASYFGIRYMYSAHALGHCQCLQLARNQLMPILKSYVDV